MNLLPIAMKVAQTIGLELVEVKPMSAPIGKIFYMDNLVDKKSIRKSKIESLFN